MSYPNDDWRNNDAGELQWLEDSVHDIARAFWGAVRTIVCSVIELCKNA